MHPQRASLHNELHARPSLYFAAPAHLHHYAFLDADGDCDRLIARLAHDLGEAIDLEMAQGVLTLEGMVLKWERHTEFFTLTLLVPVQPDTKTWPAPPPLLAEIIEAHREQVINATLLRVEDEVNVDGDLTGFGFRNPAGSVIGGGDATVWSDFRLTEDGVNHLLIVNHHLSDYRLGRMTRRLLEIETYRMMASLALPLAKELSGEMRQFEEELAALSDRNAAAEETDSRPLLRDITALSARMVNSSAGARVRFSATDAYSKIVFNRIEELRETRTGDSQRFGLFILRRFRPTVRYCAAIDRRQSSLEQSVAHLSDLLRTRAQVEIEEQNAVMLKSLNERTSSQLKIQKAVEGLSIIVISYYILSLFKLSLEGLDAVGLGMEPRQAAAIVAPLGILIIGGLAWRIWKVRKH
ncbi:DUF3422 domain-containing protein [Onishia niordana]|uniref:DUF3422 domain-containing protein n=1 Tax=Onishia niordana TaxID=2508711 RepID=UPI00109F8B35|nr:DUF3422 domain-containing protein [Halomonas niordiana]